MGTSAHYKDLLILFVVGGVQIKAAYDAENSLTTYYGCCYHHPPPSYNGSQ